MAHTIQDHGNEGWTVNRKRIRGVEEDGNNEDMEEGAAKCRKFGIILGGFRTEVEVLADLHLKYTWVQPTKRINNAGRLQTTQHTSGGAVTADSSCCANCVEPSRPPQWGFDLPFLGMPAIRTRWMAGAAAHKSG